MSVTRPRGVPRPEFAVTLWNNLWDVRRIIDFIEQIDGPVNPNQLSIAREADHICRSLSAQEVAHVVRTMLGDGTLWINGGDDGSVDKERVRSVLLEEWYGFNPHMRGHVEERYVVTDVQVMRTARYVDELIHAGILGLPIAVERAS